MFIKHTWYIFVGTAILVLLLLAEQARSQEYNEMSRTLSLHGPTTQLQVNRAISILREEEVDIIFMSGPGGSFYPGLMLGRAIQSEGARVIIPSGSKCISSCAFAALGSPNITIDGELWFHRGFALSVPAFKTIDEIGAMYSSVALDTAEYLLNVGFPIVVTKQIVTQSSYCKYLVVNNTEHLNDMRSDNPIIRFVREDTCGNVRPVAR